MRGPGALPQRRQPGPMPTPCTCCLLLAEVGLSSSLFLKGGLFTSAQDRTWAAWANPLMQTHVSSFVACPGVKVRPRQPGWAPGGWAVLLLWVEGTVAKRSLPGDLQPGGSRPRGGRRVGRELSFSSVSQADGSRQGKWAQLCILFLNLHYTDQIALQIILNSCMR